MRNAIGNALLFNIVITMIILIIAFLAASLSYTKAFRVKNNIINSVEKNNGYNQAEIDALLSEVGYRVNEKGIQTCVANGHTGGQVLTTASNYRYCIVKHTVTHGVYYGVTAYMYFDIPIINSLLEFPIYGESKVIYNIE